MQTLAPYLGADNMRVSVALRLNTDKRQINETNFNPEGKSSAAAFRANPGLGARNAAREPPAFRSSA